MIEIPVSIPDLGGNEEKYVLDALRSTWISSTGEFVDRFEREFADLCQTQAAISVANGTVALHLALLALDVQPGDEVILPSLTYVATANAVRYLGADPVFVDVEPDTWCMDTSALQAAITSRTKGLIAVHLYGHPADMDEITAVAECNGLWVVEDAAEAHFASYKGRTTGSLGNIATFSFYGNKTLTSGEGGAVTVSNPELEARMRMLRGQGMDPQRRYYFPIVGYNYRLTNLACAILCAQLERRDHILSQRRRIYTAYERGLTGVSGLSFQPTAPWAEVTPWLFCLLTNASFPLTRDALASALLQRGIDTRPFFVPVHTLPPYQQGAACGRSELPVTEDLASRGLNLPTYPDLTDQQVATICDAIRSLA